MEEVCKRLKGGQAKKRGFRVGTIGWKDHYLIHTTDSAGLRPLRGGETV